MRGTVGGFCTQTKLCILALMGAMLAAGCGSASSPGSVKLSAETTPIDPATVGSITGVVRLAGSPPALKAIDMSAAPACVKANSSPVIPPQTVTGENGALANVVIYIKTGLGDRHFETPKDPVILEQKACMYEPHVIALMVNQRLEVRNEDPTSHNVHLLAKANQPWNKSQPVDGPAIEESFPKPELAIPVACNVHPWMRAFAFVFDNPYHAITSQNGAFDLKNIAPGTYVLEAWQERYGTLDQSVTIGPKESKTISFTFNSESSVAAVPPTISR